MDFVIVRSLLTRAHCNMLLRCPWVSITCFLKMYCLGKFYGVSFLQEFPGRRRWVLMNGLGSPYQMLFVCTVVQYPRWELPMCPHCFRTDHVHSMTITGHIGCIGFLLGECHAIGPIFCRVGPIHGREVRNLLDGRACNNQKTKQSTNCSH